MSPTHHIGRFISGSLLTGVAFMMQISPDDAVTNLTKWLMLAGVPKPSDGVIFWLNTHVDMEIINYLLFLESALCFIWFFWLDIIKLLEAIRKKYAAPAPIIAQPFIVKAARAAPIPKKEPEPPIDLSVLYAKNEEDEIIYLRFLPDNSDSQEMACDVLVLILYGYKMLDNREKVSVSLLNASIAKSGCVRNNAANLLLGIAGYLAARAPIPADEIAANCRYHVGQKIDLASGGAYKLTDSGIIYAGNLAKDLIWRA